VINTIRSLTKGELIDHFSEIKEKDLHAFRENIKQLKVLFVKSESISELDKIAYVFKRFKIHSGVPLIVEKLLTGNFDDCGGSLVYALDGLRKNQYRKRLIKICKRKTISWEMKAMFYKIGIRKNWPR
jgi:hypothetical protein